MSFFFGFQMSDEVVCHNYCALYFICFQSFFLFPFTYQWMPATASLSTTPLLAGNQRLHSRHASMTKKTTLARTTAKGDDYAYPLSDICGGYGHA